MEWARSSGRNNKVAPWPTHLNSLPDEDDGAASDTKVMFMRPTKPSTTSKRTMKLGRSHSLDARLRPKLKRTNATEEIDHISPKRPPKISPTIVIEMPRGDRVQGLGKYYGDLPPKDEVVHLKPVGESFRVKDGKRKSKRRRRHGWRERKREVSVEMQHYQING